MVGCKETGVKVRIKPFAGVQNPQRLRVLIVDDESTIAMGLEMLLEELEAEVIGVAMSAAEADVLVAVEQPDVVTMDVDIKGDRDGVHAAQSIFENHGIRSIFISGYSDLEMRQRAEPCNAIGWIEKPVQKAALAAALDKVTRNAD